MKNFDMIFVFKDYKRKIVSVTAIPMTQLDSIKDWLKYVCVCVCVCACVCVGQAKWDSH